MFMVCEAVHIFLLNLPCVFKYYSVFSSFQLFFIQSYFREHLLVLIHVSLQSLDWKKNTRIKNTQTPQ